MCARLFSQVGIAFADKRKNQKAPTLQDIMFARIQFALNMYNVIGYGVCIFLMRVCAVCARGARAIFLRYVNVITNTCLENCLNVNKH